ncbi:MAG: class I SAM-dependent methyltransferase [Solirubrobacterales bacterium]|nr:class I SAM-dependent methyltransferase [Solirubrobacterales bacterium]
MRDPLGLNERLFAFYYPRLVERAENAGQRETRHGLISEARGTVLEVGAGSGLNLPHYTSEVSELIVTEPSPHMLSQLRRLLDEDPPPVGSWKLSQAGAEQLPFDDARFDTVVCTYVLCTVEDPERAVAEFTRVLAPGGRLLFLEHVHAGEGTLLGRFQDLIELPHRYIAAGCHPNRRTAQLLEHSGLELERLEHGSQPRSVPTVRPTIIGAARRADAVGAGGR